MGVGEINPFNYLDCNDIGFIMKEVIMKCKAVKNDIKVINFNTFKYRTTK